MLADREADRQTDVLITILCFPTGCSNKHTTSWLLFSCQNSVILSLINVDYNNNLLSCC